MKLLSTTLSFLLITASTSFAQCNDFGNVSQLPSSSSHSANYLLGSAIVVPSAGDLTTVSMIAISGGPSFQVAIYDDAGGAPGNLLTSASGTLTTGLNTVDVPDVSIAAGTYYMMAVFNTTASVGFDSGGTETVWYIPFNYGGTLPDPFGTPTTYTGQIFNYYFEVCGCADQIAPTASDPSGVTVECSADIPVPNVDDVIDEADNSGIAPTVAFVADVSDNQSCPETIIRTYSVTDDCGNSINVNQTIVVHDQSGPIPDLNSLPDVTGECSVPAPSAPTSTDGCSGVITGVADATFPIQTPGTTSITWTFTDDCGNTTTQNQNIIVTEIDNTVSLTGYTISANAGGYSYQWIDCDNGNAPIVSETNQWFTATTGGNYAVEISDGVCTVTSECTQIDIIGINESVIENIQIYPNPAFDGDLFFTESSQIDKIELIDVLGRIQDIDFNKGDGSIDVSSLASGKYIVKIQTNLGSVTRQVIVRN